MHLICSLLFFYFILTCHRKLIQYLYDYAKYDLENQFMQYEKRFNSNTQTQILDFIFITNLKGVEILVEGKTKAMKDVQNSDHIFSDERNWSCLSTFL